MPTTEELMLVRIEANITQLQREMRKASGAAEQASRRIKSSFSSAFKGGFLGGLASGLIHNLDDMALAAIRNADALVDQADSLNANVEELQKLQIVLRQLGGSEEDAGAGLAFFTKQLGKAQAGQGDLVAILKSAKIPLKDSNGDFRAREAVLRDLIHAMSLMTSEEQRFLVSTLAFGRNAAQSYNNLAEAGVAAWDKLAKGAVDSGQVQKEAEARALAESQDSIDDFLGWLKRGYSDAIAVVVELVQQPGLYWDIALSDIKEATGRFFNWFKSGWDAAINSVIDSINSMGFALKHITTVTTTTESGPAKVVKTIEDTGDAADAATPKVKKLKEALLEHAAAKREELRISGAFKDAAADETAGYNAQEAAVRKVIAAKQKAGTLPVATAPDLVAGGPDVTPGVVAPTVPDPEEIKRVKEAREAVEEYVSIIATRQQVYADSKHSIEDQIKALQVETDATHLTAEAADELRARVELLNAAHEAGLEVTPELQTEIDNLAASYGHAAEAARKAGDAQRAAAQLAESIGGAFEDAFVSAVTQADNLQDALKNLLKTLLELFARAAFARAVGGLFGGSGPVAGAIGGFFGGGGAAAVSAVPGTASAAGGGNQAVAVHITADASPLLHLTIDSKAHAAEERAVSRGPAVARANNQRYATP